MPAVRWLGALRRLWGDQLSLRLVTVVFCLALSCTAALTWYGYRSQEVALEKQLNELAKTVAKILGASWGDAIVTEDIPALEESAEFLLHETNLTLTFVTMERADGKVLNIRNAPSIEEMRRPDVLVVSAPVLLRPENRELGKVYIGFLLSPWQRLLTEHTVRMFAGYLAAFGLISTVMMVLLHRWLGRPLRRLDEAARRIGQGDLAQPVESIGTGQLGRLAGTLEQMRRNVGQSHASLAEQNARLRDLDRLKDEFLANMSHEIRTPLSAVIGSAELLPELEGQERDEALDAVRRNSQHLLYLVNQILDFSKLQSGNLALEQKDAPLRPLIDDLIACLRPKATEKHLHLHLWWRDDAPAFVRTDPLRLRQIVMNLISNSLKFTAQGGIDITVGSVAAESGPQIEITIADSGIGIPALQLDRLFVPFTQGDASMTRRFGGTGLGLAISRQLARALGGDVTLASTVGVGTKAKVTLPLLLPQTEVQVAAPAAAAAPLRGRVLLVDDAPDNRRLLGVVLKKAGADVETAENGELACQAVARASAAGRAFDLVLMDIQMPVLDGYAAAERIRRTGFTAPIVALTAHATEQDRERCRSSGFDDYASKPIARNQLVELVRRHVSQGS